MSPPAKEPLRFRLHVHLPREHSLGPGKVALLEAVDRHGSIAAAARALDMAYRHAWELVDDVNRCFREPAIVGATGGERGGGAVLTPFGRELVKRFRRMERVARGAMAGDLRALEAALRAAPSARRARRSSRTRAPASRTASRSSSGSSAPTRPATPRSPRRSRSRWARPFGCRRPRRPPPASAISSRRSRCCATRSSSARRARRSS